MEKRLTNAKIVLEKNSEESCGILGMCSDRFWVLMDNEVCRPIFMVKNRIPSRPPAEQPAACQFKATTARGSGAPALLVAAGCSGAQHSGTQLVELVALQN